MGFLRAAARLLAFLQPTMAFRVARSYTREGA